MDRTLNLAKTGLLLGLAIWLSLIAFNNATDPATNTALLRQTITMDALQANPEMGNGLQWRAWPASLATPMLVGVIVAQSIIALLLWRAATLFGLRTLRTDSRSPDPGVFSREIAAANLALGAFMSLWFFFLCGGLWFGYWIEMGPVQGVHMTLLMVTLLSLLLVNHRPQATTMAGESRSREESVVTAPAESEEAGDRVAVGARRLKEADSSGYS